jgi:hypothetical protein
MPRMASGRIKEDIWQYIAQTAWNKFLIIKEYEGCPQFHGYVRKRVQISTEELTVIMFSNFLDTLSVSTECSVGTFGFRTQIRQLEVYKHLVRKMCSITLEPNIDNIFDFIVTFFFVWIPFYLQAVQIRLAKVKLLQAWRGVLSSTPPYKYSQGPVCQ